MNSSNFQRTLYCENLDNFMNTRESDFIEMMKQNLMTHGYAVGDSEISSWKENNSALKKIFRKADLPKDVVIAFEYQLPIGGRVDCILCGQDAEGKNQIIVIELKQWTEVNRVYDSGLLETFTGGRLQDVLHPVQQANDYKRHLLNHFEFLFDGTYEVWDVAYCYNYSRQEDGQDAMFDNLPRNLTDTLFCKSNKDAFCDFLKTHLTGGKGYDIMRKLDTTQPLPTRQLLQAAADIVFEGNDDFTLFGEQHEAFQRIEGLLKKTLDNEGKSVIVIKGGPGTGKTVLALKLLAEACRMGRTSMFTTRSTALRDQLRNILRKQANVQGNTADDLVRTIFDFRPAMYKESQIDLLIIDEAHRIAAKSNDQSDGNYVVQVENDGEASVYCPFSQALALMYCSKVTVFFIDDKQAVESPEIGKSAEIITIAKSYKKSIEKDIERFKKEYEKKNYLQKVENCKQEIEKLDISSSEYNEGKKNLDKLQREQKHIHGLKVIHNEFEGNIDIYEKELSTQFRCQGADKYVAWVDQVLYCKPEDVNIHLQQEDFDFRIYNDPRKLYEEIKRREEEGKKHNSDYRPSRLVAGWCWPWSKGKDQTDPETQDLKHEVVIGENFSMPWETTQLPPKKSPFRNKYAPDTNSFASHYGGINQVGCIYTAQGFEFEYVGVIIGPDLQYDSKNDCLKCIPENNQKKKVSGDIAQQLIRNIYRVLMTRGRKGCYIYCCDENVASYLKRFISTPEEFVYD